MKFSKLIYIARNAAEMGEKITLLLKKRVPIVRLQYQKTFAEQNSWIQKIDSMSKIINVDAL